MSWNPLSSVFGNKESKETVPPQSSSTQGESASSPAASGPSLCPHKYIYLDLATEDRVEGDGQVTSQGRLDWCRSHGITDTRAISRSREADRDSGAPLYYWQLYSLLGMERIEAMVTDFYKNVFADEEELWFREAFVALNNMKGHIEVQTLYWADSMGGGTFYLGGETRADYHHEAKVQARFKRLMTGGGARRWMQHMTRALVEGGHLARFNAIDRRIFPCVVEFLRVKMERYALVFNWAFDPRPFDELDQIHIESLR
jgi:truncated hemoglobin YjbI